MITSNNFHHIREVLRAFKLTPMALTDPMTPLSVNMASIQREYQQWDATHSAMMDTPPSDGRDYIRHAQNLLPLLDAISEFHPFVKGEYLPRLHYIDSHALLLGAVASFKAVIQYEQNRRENETRVTAVFLAQTDTMRVVLE
jgi:hypothetical protein